MRELFFAVISNHVPVFSRCRPSLFNYPTSFIPCCVSFFIVRTQAAHHPALSQSLDLLVFLEASDSGLEAAKSYIEVRTTTGEGRGEVLVAEGDVLVGE